MNVPVLVLLIGQALGDTPWQFFREGVAHADSLSKWLALIFFTVALTSLYLPRFLLSILVVVGVLALVNAHVRHSWLVRSGLALSLLGFAALAIAGRFNDNPLGVGFLFAFTRPIAAVMLVVGALHALTMQAWVAQTDTGLHRDIDALVASAERSRPSWPDEPPLPEIERVATHGSRAGSALVELLGAEFDDPSRTNPRNVHVEQQAALALCRIYSVLPTAGETVRDARSTPQDSGDVSGFWRRKIDATNASG